MKNINGLVCVIMILLLVFSMVSTVMAADSITTASARIQGLANEESAWRYISGGLKLIFGGVITATGYSIFSFRENIGAIVMIPLGAALMVPGILTLGWGTSDLLFGSREYENQYDRLKALPDPDRENASALYLKTKAEKDNKDRQPGFWNAFGLFSLLPTPAEREYAAYLKDTSKLEIKP